MEALQIVSSFYCFLPSWRDKIEFFVHGLVSVLWWWVFFFFPSHLLFLAVAVVSGGQEGGRGGDWSVCMWTESLLTEHMACLLLRSRSTAKPQRSRRGCIPGAPEGPCGGCCNPGRPCKLLDSRAAGRRGSFWKEIENGGKICFQNFYLSASCRRSTFAVF